MDSLLRSMAAMLLALLLEVGVTPLSRHPARPWDAARASPDLREDPSAPDAERDSEDLLGAGGRIGQNDPVTERLPGAPAFRCLHLPPACCSQLVFAALGMTFVRVRTHPQERGARDSGKGVPLERVMSWCVTDPDWGRVVWTCLRKCLRK